MRQVAYPSPRLSYLGPIAYWPNGSWVELTEPMGRLVNSGRATSFKVMPGSCLPLKADDITARVGALNALRAEPGLRERVIAFWPSDHWCEYNDMERYMFEMGLSDDCGLVYVKEDADDEAIERLVMMVNRM